MSESLVSPNSKSLAKSFRPPAFPGSFFLSFEGIEGAGKSTQILLARNYLESLGFRVLCLREPGGTSFGEKLRQAILDSRADLHPIAEMHLFASSRAQLLLEVTLQELAVPGTVVIYDRYIDSSLAYQGGGRDLGIDKILQCHQDFPLTLTPHLTVYLDIDLETSFSRQHKRNIPQDYFESQGGSFYQKVLEGYNELIKLFPERIVLIDGGKEEKAIFESIKPLLEGLVRSVPSSQAAL